MRYAVCGVRWAGIVALGMGSGAPDNLIVDFPAPRCRAPTGNRHVPARVQGMMHAERLCSNGPRSSSLVPRSSLLQRSSFLITRPSSRGHLAGVKAWRLWATVRIGLSARVQGNGSNRRIPLPERAGRACRTRPWALGRDMRECAPLASLSSLASLASPRGFRLICPADHCAASPGGGGRGGRGNARDGRPPLACSWAPVSGSRGPCQVLPGMASSPAPVPRGAISTRHECFVSAGRGSSDSAEAR
jgi:hypothetical protein